MASSHDPSTSSQDISETLTGGDTMLPSTIESAPSNPSLSDNVDTLAVNQKTTVETISAPDDSMTARTIEPVSDQAMATQHNDSEANTDDVVADDGVDDGVEGGGLEEGGAESDEEEKRAILAEENILTLEESEKVRDSCQ